jgi:hypothetical protein
MGKSDWPVRMAWITAAGHFTVTQAIAVGVPIDETCQRALEQDAQRGRHPGRVGLSSLLGIDRIAVDTVDLSGPPGVRR